MSAIGKCWRNLRELPWVLAVMCKGFMLVSPLFLVVFTFFGADVDGRDETGTEIWRSLEGLGVMLFLTLATAGSWGIAAKRPNARWFAVSLGVIPELVIVPSLSGQPFGELVGYAIGGWPIALLLYICLFRLQSVRAYFFDDALRIDARS